MLAKLFDKKMMIFPSIWKMSACIIVLRVLSCLICAFVLCVIGYWCCFFFLEEYGQFSFVERREDLLRLSLQSDESSEVVRTSWYGKFEERKPSKRRNMLRGSKQPFMNLNVAHEPAMDYYTANTVHPLRESL